MTNAVALKKAVKGTDVPASESSTLPNSGGIPRTVERLRELNKGLLQTEAAFPTVYRLASLMENLTDTCYSDRWKGVYSAPSQGKTYPKATLATGVVRFVRKPAQLPIDGNSLFLKAEVYADPDGGTAQPSDESLNEVAIGTRLNMLIEANLLRGFVRLVDWYLCKSNWVNPRTGVAESRGTVFTLQESAPSRLADAFLDADSEGALSLLANLLLTLEAAQDLVGYVHYDMHIDNVHMAAFPASQASSAVLRYTRPNGTQMYLTKSSLGDREVKLIDFGRNRMSTSYVFSDQLSEVINYSNPDIGITADFHPFYDMRTFSIVLASKKGLSGQALLEEPEMANILPILDLAAGSEYVPSTEEEYDERFGKGEWTECRKLVKANAKDFRIPLFESLNDSVFDAKVTLVLRTLKTQGVAGLAALFQRKSRDWDTIDARNQPLDLGEVGLIALAYWVWTPHRWPGLTPEGLLDEPQFDFLRNDPGVGPVADATDYRSMAKFKLVGERAGHA